MLAPHDREDPELSEIWLASEDFSDALELVRRQTMLRHKVRCDRRISGGAGHRRDTVANLSSSTNWNGRLLASAFAGGPSVYRFGLCRERSRAFCNSPDGVSQELDPDPPLAPCDFVEFRSNRGLSRAV